MLIKVKKEGLNKKNRKKQGEGERTKEREKRRREKQSFGKSRFLITNSSVEVGYGLCYS